MKIKYTQNNTVWGPRKSFITAKRSYPLFDILPVNTIRSFTVSHKSLTDSRSKEEVKADLKAEMDRLRDECIKTFDKRISAEKQLQDSLETQSAYLEKAGHMTREGVRPIGHGLAKLQQHIEDLARQQDEGLDPIKAQEKEALIENRMTDVLKDWAKEAEDIMEERGLNVPFRYKEDYERVVNSVFEFDRQSKALETAHSEVLKKYKDVKEQYESKRSLVDDYADVSTEPQDFTGGDD